MSQSSAHTAFHDRLRLSGVLVTYRRLEELSSTIENLERQTRPLDALVVVDNGNDPDVADLVSRGGRRTPITYISPAENLGPAGGYAIGMRTLLDTAEPDDWVIALDDDDPPYFDDAFENIERFAAEMHVLDPTIGGVGISGGRFEIDRARVKRVGDSEINGPVLVDHITGGGLPTYRIDAIRQVGVFDSDLFFGFEELEYGLRMTSERRPLYADGTQWKRRKEVKREAGHLPPESESAARAAKTNLALSSPSWRRYYSLRNLVYVLRKHGATWPAVKVSLVRGFGKPLANMFVSPAIAWRALRLNAKAVRDAWTGRMGRTVEPGQ